MTRGKPDISSTWSRFNLPLLGLCLALSKLPSANLCSQEKSLSSGDANQRQISQIEHLCLKFHEFGATGDFEQAKQLVAQDAQWLRANGRLPMAVQRVFSDRKKKLKEKPNAPFELKTLVHQEIQLLPNNAVVTQVFETTTNPRRLTLVLSKEPSWHIIHLHSSKYDGWESSIDSFTKADAKEMPEPGGVVFVGSSSIRMWRNLKDYFPDSHTIQRGFGGSQLMDLRLYAKQIVTKYRPSKIAIYEGDNDIGSGKSADVVLRDFQEFVAQIHRELPEAKIGFIAIKPSLKRWNLWPEMKNANDMIREFTLKNEKLKFLDISQDMLGPDGQPKPEMFVSDGLHMTKAGYESWAKVIQPWLAE